MGGWGGDGISTGPAKGPVDHGDTGRQNSATGARALSFVRGNRVPRAAIQPRGLEQKNGRMIERIGGRGRKAQGVGQCTETFVPKFKAQFFLGQIGARWSQGRARGDHGEKNP